MKPDGRCHCGYVTFEAEADLLANLIADGRAFFHRKTGPVAKAGAPGRHQPGLAPRTARGGLGEGTHHLTALRAFEAAASFEDERGWPMLFIIFNALKTQSPRLPRTIE